MPVTWLCCSVGLCFLSAHNKASPSTLDYQIVKRHAHNPRAFTQGLLFDSKGQLIESSGNYGQSYIARLSANSATLVEQKVKLGGQYFAEGIALFGKRLFALTWKAGRAIELDADSLVIQKSHSYRGEGWGLTANGSQLIMSNGGHQLHFRNPDTFALERTLPVSLNGKPLKALNELEWVAGKIYANIWYADIIVAISSETGEVLSKVDLSALRHAQGKRADALNGIAYNPRSGNFWVTGKYWRYLYEIKLAPAKVD